MSVRHNPYFVLFKSFIRYGIQSLTQVAAMLGKIKSKGKGDVPVLN